MRTMEISKLTSKYQATIPAVIREQLGLHKGDAVAFHVEDGRVVLTKSPPIDWEFAVFTSHAMSEWKSPEDEEAFKHL